VARVESLPPDVPVPLAKGGQFVHWREKMMGGGVVEESTTDGWPALVAAGSLHYLAGWPDEATLDRILMAACAAQGLNTDPLPEGLRRRDTATHRFWFNYNPVPVEWGGVTIEPAGVHWHAL
jgi:beta-galactosidase